jgi:SAM-dependent methyltransferase
MEWVIAKVEGTDVEVANFDVAGSGETVYEPQTLYDCEEWLGAVYWKEAVELFLPFLSRKIKKQAKKGIRLKRALCLGEGTGASGLALAALHIFKRVFITDLQPLLPLLEFNVNLNQRNIRKGVCKAKALDWLNDEDRKSFKKGKFDVAIGCEVLYGNRETWPGLIKVLKHTLRKGGIAYFCVTLRNKHKDVDAFTLLAEESGYLIKGKEWMISENHMVVFELIRI